MSFLSYARVGSVDYHLAGLLIAGTVPGVYVGTSFNAGIDKEKLKKGVNVIIFAISMLVLLRHTG